MEFDTIYMMKTRPVTPAVAPQSSQSI